MEAEFQHNTPLDDSQDNTQLMGSPSEQSESVWGRFIPVCADHEEASLNQVFEFRDPVVTIGRDPSNDISLKCPIISSRHFKLHYNCDNGLQTIFLEDTSTNGTWINKKRISKKRVLIDDGVEIILIPRSSRRNRKKLSYFFHLENKQRHSQTRLESKYYIVGDLGKGAFSTVKLVQDRNTTQKYALKCIDRSAWRRLQHATKRDVNLLDEVEIMKKTNHPNILKVHEYYEEEDKVNVILDYCGGGDMLEYIQKNGAYTSSKGRLMFKQLIDSVDYLHSLRIAHRDLKPDNILLTDEKGDVLKISDFGISREQNSSGCGTIIGTPLYQAPEVHHRRSQFMSGYDGILADYWSLGVILYVMLVAAPPINANESSSVICELSEQRTLPWYDEAVPETAKDLIYKLLQTDPHKRITAKDIYKHPWMCGYDRWTDVKCNGVQCMMESKELEEDVHNGEEYHNNNKRTPTLSTTSKDRSLSTESSMDSESSARSLSSRKRRAEFDDDEEISKPPTKKQKTNPKPIQDEGMGDMYI